MFGDDCDEANLGATVREGAAGGVTQEAGELTPCTLHSRVASDRRSRLFQGNVLVDVSIKPEGK